MRPVIYIQADKHTSIHHVVVRAGDLCSIYCKDKKIKYEAEQTVVCRLKEADDGSKQTASILWLISKLDKTLTCEVEFENIGETEFIFSVDFGKKKKKGRMLKMCIVAGVTFAGSVFAIMTYNEDVSTMGVFEKISGIFGYGEKGVHLLAAGYAVGIAAGIILFFNHFGKRRLSSDPTPMEVEMEKYESDIDDTLIKKNSRRGKSLDHC